MRMQNRAQIEFRLFLCCLVTAVVLPRSSKGTDVALTVNVAAGTEECLHQPMVQGVDYEVEFQVIDGGDLDINFYASTPSKNTFITDYKKSSQTHKRTASESGDYRFCMDNSFSHFQRKLVYFEIYMNDGLDGEDDEQFETLPDENDYEIKLEDFKESLDKIKDHLQKSAQAQKIFSVVESRDRILMEHNFERINFWSAVQLIVMVIAGVVNVILIRRLFIDRSRVTTATKQRT